MHIFGNFLFGLWNAEQARNLPTSKNKKRIRPLIKNLVLGKRWQEIPATNAGENKTHSTK